MSILSRQQTIVEDFDFFEDWSDKYAYLIGLGKTLPEFPADKKNEAHLIKGCQSQVWFDVELQNDAKLTFYGISDAAIVSGLIGLLLKVYSGATAQQIIASNTEFMKQIGLAQHLSPTRNNGLHAMVNYIYQTAQSYVDTTA